MVPVATATPMSAVNETVSVTPGFRPTSAGVVVSSHVIQLPSKIPPSSGTMFVRFTRSMQSVTTTWLPRQPL